jgi:hypothetical protein
MTQETVAKEEPAELLNSQDLKQFEKRKQISVQEVIESLKSISDDIGQISELNSEEKILVAQFFASFFKLMQPLASSIVVSQLVLPTQLGNVIHAYIDPTGRLVLQFDDNHVEVKDLSEIKNRDLMMTVVGDVMPKFKSLTSNQKHKIENRIKLLSSVTKEIQKSSEALSAALPTGQ